ncbi:MAG: lytic transglycosylase domain-containing protein [Rhodobacteraceae bacterium]|nr:lytic transglycosylase domain-containing protein [Paracoccaceae bacterium]
MRPTSSSGFRGGEPMNRRSSRLCKAIVIVCVSGVLIPQGARAETIDRDSALCERAVVEGARMTGVPQEILHAITLTETGRKQAGRMRPWPWAINREGEGRWFRGRAEALAFARESLTAGRTSFDVGCFQINYRWHGQHFDSLEQMFDPIAGAVYAGMFLRDLHAETGNWSKAAGSYHSRTPDLSVIYQARFDRILEGLAHEAPLVVRADAASKTGRSRLRLSKKPLIINIAPKPADTEAPEARREEHVAGEMPPFVPAAAYPRGLVAPAARVRPGGIF